MRRWNYDKPHRCPECHAIWTWGVRYEGTELDRRPPRWWRVYRCYRCGTKFAGWGWDGIMRRELRIMLSLLFRVAIPITIGWFIAELFIKP